MSIISSVRYISVIFDGTSRLGEVLEVVLHYVDSDFNIQQRLVRMMFLMKCTIGDETARELSNEQTARESSNELSVSYSNPPHILLATMRDVASVNSVAMHTISIVYPNMLDVRCISHTID